MPWLADWCILDIVDDDGTVRRLEVAHVDPSRNELAQRLRQFPAGPSNPGSPASRVLATARPELLAETVDDLLVRASAAPEHLGLLRALGPSSALVVPLLARGRTVGALSLFAAESGRRYTQEDLAVVEELARRCALSVDNARILAAERRERATTETLQAITSALSRALTPSEAGDVIIQLGLPGIEADAGAVALLNEETQLLEMVRSIGYPQDMVEAFQQTPLAASTPMAQAARLRQPVWRESSTAPMEYADYARVNQRFPAGVALPLLVEGRVLGALAFSFVAPRTFDERARAFAGALAAQCALALERARLYTAERGARALAEASVIEHRAAEERLAFLAEASNVLGASLDYERTLARVVELAVPRVADVCVIDMVEPDGSVRRLPMGFAAAVPNSLREAVQATGAPTLDGGGLAAEILRTGRVYMQPHVTDADLVATARDEVHLQLLRAAGIRSTILLPIVARGRVLGALTLITAEHSGRTYSDAELELAQELARRAAQAIDNAQLFEAEQVARATAEAALRARDEFLSIASHELRTPVAAIKSLAQLLRRSRDRGLLDNERLDRSLSQLSASSDRLVTLTNDLLDVSRLQSGRFDLRTERVDLGVMLTEQVETTRQQLDEQYALTLHVEDTCEVDVDRIRLEQVIANLISNAAKYSPGGGPIKLCLAKRDDGMLLSVSDQGIGLPPDQLTVIFEPFGRATNASNRHIQGMGLGLYICRQIVERHDGRLWAESPGEDAGTTMNVWLPC